MSILWQKRLRLSLHAPGATGWVGDALAEAHRLYQAAGDEELFLGGI